MAYSLLKIANIPNTSYSFFKADTVADMNAIPTEHLTHGSECLVIATGARYILNSSAEWVEQPSGGGGGGGGTPGEDGATFTPSVSEQGIISWTNDKDLPNPESVDLAAAVIATLPLYDGSVLDDGAAEFEEP